VYLYVDSYDEHWKLHISDKQHAHYTLPLINALWTCHFCQILSFLCDMQFHYLKYFNKFPNSTSIRTLSSF